jgi:hypothetical protein
MMRLLKIFTIALFLTTIVNTVAQTLNEQQKISIINKALELIKDNYVFPDKYNNIATAINKNLNQNIYSKYSDPQEFLNILNNDLQVAGGDKHLKISFSPQLVMQIRDEREEAKKGESQRTPYYTPELLSWIKYQNFGLRKVERMGGNIGYFKFDQFVDLRLAKESIIGAMNFISNSSAIILDLRENGGGDAQASEFFLNYFLPDDTEIGKVKFRNQNKSKDVIIQNNPDIKKIPADIPLYILVSRKTASAAEAVAYVLQQFKRAIVIGDQTSGKANPGELFVVNDFLYMMVPTGSFTVKPTGTNWEGIGVTPDCKIDQAKALTAAMIEICNKLRTSDNNEEHKKEYEWLLFKYNSILNPTIPSSTFINSLTGNYQGNRKIILENGLLFYINNTLKERLLTYMGHQTFSLEANDNVRLKFPDTFGPVNYFEFIWSDGTVEKINRIN